jgi:hypothetical protein
LLSKARKPRCLSEKMPSKPMTRLCFGSETCSPGAPRQMLPRALKGGSFMTRLWRARFQPFDAFRRQRGDR